MSNRHCIKRENSCRKNSLEDYLEVVEENLPFRLEAAAMIINKRKNRSRFFKATTLFHLAKVKF